MSRLTWDTVYLLQAYILAERATCVRRKVGCILVDENYHVLSSGYNGPARKEPHCTDTPCAGANLPSGTGLDQCVALHAETNALARLPSHAKLHTAYVTTAPCIGCIKQLKAAGCIHIRYGVGYPHLDTTKAQWLGVDGLTGSTRTIERVDPEEMRRWLTNTAINLCD